jgi:hypothetical protein
MITELHGTPEQSPMGSRETLPFRFDVSPLLLPGETPSAPAATLTRLDTGALYPAGLQGAATITGTYVTQAVTGLTKGITYRLSLQFQAAAGKVFSVLLDIPCRD